MADDLVTLWAKARAKWQKEEWRTPDRPQEDILSRDWDHYVRDDELYYRRVCRSAGYHGAEHIAICCILDSWADRQHSKYRTQHALIAAAHARLKELADEGQSPIQVWAEHSFYLRVR